MNRRIFFVEDDKIIARQIAKYLRGWGYDVEVPADFARVYEAFCAYKPHIVLMDVGLPYYNGYHWCKTIREVSDVPIVFLSAQGENMNMLMAMEMGADDYIVKPYDPALLQAKIAALLRRAYDYGEPERALVYEGIALDADRMEIHAEEGVRALTKNEYRILEFLVKNAGKIVSRDEIIEAIWDRDDFVDDNTLTVNIMRLRKKLRELDRPEIIRTKKGVGYYVP